MNDGFAISVGRSVQLEAVAEDVYGNVIDDANFEWQAVRREDRITGEGVFTAGTAVSNGTRELVRLVTSHEGVELNTEVTGAISSGIIDRVDVTPPGSHSKAGRNGETGGQGIRPVWKCGHAGLDRVDSR